MCNRRKEGDLLLSSKKLSRNWEGQLLYTVGTLQDIVTDIQPKKRSQVKHQGMKSDHGGVKGMAWKFSKVEWSKKVAEGRRGQDQRGSKGRKETPVIN